MWKDFSLSGKGMFLGAVYGKFLVSRFEFQVARRRGNWGGNRVFRRSRRGKLLTAKDAKKDRKGRKKNLLHSGDRKQRENRITARLDHLLSKKLLGFSRPRGRGWEFLLKFGAPKADKRSFDSFGRRLTSLKMTGLI
jgi:hypothetical protein